MEKRSESLTQIHADDKRRCMQVGAARDTSNGKPNKWFVFGIVAVAVFMSTLDSSIVNIALPSIMRDFQIPLVLVEWVSMMYLLTVSSLLLLCGRLSDIYGRRLVYCGGFIVFCLGSFLCALSAGPVPLIIFRAIQGVGAAMLMACSPALIVDAFPEKERGGALGMVGMAVAAGLVSGPALGGLLLQYFPWQSIFYINIPIGLFITMVAWFVLKRVPQTLVNEPLDWPGSIFLALTFGSFIAGLTHIHDWGVHSSLFRLVCLLFAVSMGTLVWVEKKSSHPIIHASLLKIRLFNMSILAAIILFMGLFFITFLMPFFMVNPMAFPMAKVGGIMMTPFVFQFCIAPVAGFLSASMESRSLCTIGMAILACALFALSQLRPNATVIDIGWRLALAGVGVAIFISPNSAAAMSAVPVQYRGVASGSVATARNLGMVMGIAAAGLLFNSTFSAANGGQDLKIYLPVLETAFMAAFQKTMLFGAVVVSMGIAVAYLRGRDALRTSAGK